MPTRQQTFYMNMNNFFLKEHGENSFTKSKTITENNKKRITREKFDQVWKTQFGTQNFALI